MEEILSKFMCSVINLVFLKRLAKPTLPKIQLNLAAQIFKNV